MSSDWIVVQPSLKPITDKIEPILDPVLSVVDVTIKILNVAQSILNIIKPFLIGVLDPLKPLVEQIIAEIQAAIADLRQLGFYLHGDWDLFDSFVYFRDLLGGYEAYERRMLGRLLDTRDPGRPNFSPQSATIGLFLYLTAGDTGNVGVLLDGVKKITNFFGQTTLAGNSSPYPPPKTPTVRYSAENFLGQKVFVSSDKLTESVDQLSVTWTYPQGGSVTNPNGPAPKSYIIHVSTIKDGFKLLAMQPKDDTSKSTENLQTIDGLVVDPITNKVAKVYGGLSDLYFFTDRDNPRAPRLYFLKDSNTPLIEPSLLIQNGQHIFGKSFIVGTSFFDKMSAGTPITAILNVGDLPKTADVINVNGKAALENIRDSEVFYIRVRGCTEESNNSVTNPQEVPFRLYSVFPTNIRNIRSGALLANTEAKKYTKESSPVEAKVPSEKTLSYQKAVQTAIAIMLLCRVDFSKQPDSSFFAKNTYKEGGETGLESVGRPLLQKYNVGSNFYRGNNPWNFRKSVSGLSGRIQADLQKVSAPPDSVLESIEEDIENLLNLSMPVEFFKEEINLLDALRIKTTRYGIGANPLCRGISKKAVKEIYASSFIEGPLRNPAFAFSLDSVENLSWVMGMGSGDYSPIFYNEDETAHPVFVRNWLIKEEKLLEAARNVLNIAATEKSEKDGDWITVRLLPQAVPEAEAILDGLETFLEGILDGLEGIADKIVAIIDSIQARIYQLQAIIEYIKSLLESILSFSLPGIAGLVLVEDGTAGLAGALVSSGNKPISIPSHYSAGVVAVAGGLPSILLDILVALFSGAGGQPDPQSEIRP